MCSLRRLLMRVHQELDGEEKGEPDSADIWFEFVSNLWDTYLPHLREEFYGDGLFVFDPNTQCYGFQEEEEGDEGSDDGFMDALLKEEGSFKIEDSMNSSPEETESHVIGHTYDLSLVSSDEGEEDELEEEEEEGQKEEVPTAASIAVGSSLHPQSKFHIYHHLSSLLLLYLCDSL